MESGLPFWFSFFLFPWPLVLAGEREGLFLRFPTFVCVEPLEGERFCFFLFFPFGFFRVLFFSFSFRITRNGSDVRPFRELGSPIRFAPALVDVKVALGECAVEIFPLLLFS